MNRGFRHDEEQLPHSGVGRKNSVMRLMGRRKGTAKERKSDHYLSYARATKRTLGQPTSQIKEKLEPACETIKVIKQNKEPDVPELA